MKFQQLSINGFRNLKPSIITPSPQVNLIYGANGSGKSSFLEAIYHFGFGRSFRTHQHDNLIAHQAQSFELFAQGTEGKSGQIFKVGISRNRRAELKLKVDGDLVKRLSLLAKQFPVQLYTPQSSDLLSGSPSNRRKFIDWGLFHVKQNFADQNVKFQTVLKNRNNLLRSLQKQPKALVEQIDYWNHSFCSLAEELHEQRMQYVEQLQVTLLSLLDSMLPGLLISLEYYPGWDKSKSIGSVIASKFERDVQLGYTSVGPQRADLRVRANKNDANDILSRGQLRVLTAAIMLAQNQHLVSKSDKMPVVLLDDLAAELDDENKRLLVNKLLDTNSQLFITAIQATQFSFLENYKDKKMFHVKHGEISEET